jgi:hypothetical protein
LSRRYDCRSSWKQKISSEMKQADNCQNKMSGQPTSKQKSPAYFLSPNWHPWSSSKIPSIWPFSVAGLRMCPVTSTVQLLMEHCLSFFSFSVVRVHHESSSLKFLSENDLQSSFFGIFPTTPKHRVLVTPSKIIINSIFTEFLCKKVLPTAFNTERLD